MTPERDGWLHAVFALSALACAGLAGLAIARDAQRPVQVEQRLVPALKLVDRCELCHQEPKHSADIADHHPPERFGCTPCHGGQGLATGRDAAHRAAMDWERPLFTAPEQQAACGTCHLGRPAALPQLALGRQLLQDKGCAGCHLIPGTARPDFAPALDGLRDAVPPGFVRLWLRDPARLDSAHRMPVFSLTDAEIEALLAYLWTLPGPALRPMPDGLSGDDERGKKAVASRRCATCHRVDGRGGTVGPDLALSGLKLSPLWLWNLLVDTHRLRPHTRMPGFALPEQEAADIVALAAAEWLPDSGEAPWAAVATPVDSQLAPKGQLLFADLGCGGCHRVAGQLAPPVAMALDRLGDRRVAELPVSPTGTAAPDVARWVAEKILSPRHFDQPGAAPGRMPRVPQVAPEEALAMGIALASLHANAVPDGYWVAHDPPVQPLPLGETGRLVARFRCLVCHSVGGQGGFVAKIGLDGVGSRLQRPWLAQFLQAPVTVRMDQAERMPVLGIGPIDAEYLANWLSGGLGDDRVALPAEPTAAGLAAAATADGLELYLAKGCPDCHVAVGRGTMKGPTLDGCAARLQPGYVRALLERPEVVPHGRHPIAPLTAAQARSLTNWLLGLPGSPPSP